MFAVYVLAAVIGLPLVGYAVLSGDGGDGDFGELDLDGAGGGPGSILGYLSIGTLSFFSGFFGLTGLAASAISTGTIATLISALGVGLVAAVAHRTLLSYVTQSSSSSHLADTDFDGKAAEVVVPVEPGRRGRISVLVDGQQHYLTAELTAQLPSAAGPSASAALDVGATVVIVTMEGGVAQVTHLDPELA